MNKIIRFKTKTKQNTELNEFQLSIVMHIFFLVLLSVYFAVFKVIPEKKEKKTVPIKLFAAIEQPKAGSVAPPKPVVGAQKANADLQKAIKPIAKPTPKAPAQTQVKKTPVTQTQKVVTPKPPVAKIVTEKKVAVKSAEPAKQPNQPVIAKKIEPEKIETVNTVADVDPIAAIIPEEILKTLKPVVIQEEAAKPTPIVKPTHVTTSFDKITEFTAKPAIATPLAAIEPTIISSKATAFLMPDSPFENDLEEDMPEISFASKTGTNSDSDKGRGLFEVGLIEAFGGNNETFSPPSIISRVEPDYPQWARENGVHGSAIYRVLILTSGTVGDAITMSSTIDPKLAITGAQALRRWVFTPVLVNGEPKETWVKISVQYELK